ncbi:MAG: hypothetical protein GVY27_09460 [Deinococcus-Thermus bacterium]|jgi:hypothetical protein|nr:hypothetical protein [Deinococcota bacterium]
MNRTSPLRLILPVLSLLIVAVGCLPAALDDATPDAAVIGIPANELVPGAASGLDRRLRDLDTGHDYVRASSLRFLEVRRGGVGSRAIPGAARVARSTGAELAVTVQAAVFERRIENADEAPREVAELRLEVALVRASDEIVLQRLPGPTETGERRLEAAELPALADDPLIEALVDASLDELAPRVAAALRRLALSGSSGG